MRALVASWLSCVLVGCGGSTAAGAADPQVVGDEREAAVEEAYRHEAERRRISWMALSPRAYVGDEPTDAQVQEYVAAHRAALEREYQEQRHRYTDLEPQVRVRHLLLTLAEEADVETVRRARERIDALRRRAVAGERFALLAREHSEDPGSAPHGGDLGYFPRGRMVAPFEDASFALSRPGELSPVVRTRYGLHLIEYIGRREDDVSFEEAAPELALDMLRYEREREAAAVAAGHAAEALRQGQSLGDALQLVSREDYTPDAGEEVVHRGRRLRFRGLVERAFEVTGDEPMVVGPFPIEGDLLAVMRVEVVPADARGLTDEVRACLVRRLEHHCASTREEGCGPCAYVIEPDDGDGSADAQLTPEQLQNLIELQQQGQ